MCVVFNLELESSSENKFWSIFLEKFNVSVDLKDFLRTAVVLLILLYYRSYISQLFVSFLFGIDDSRVCRLIRRIESLLAQVVAISKREKLTQEEIASLLLDATEQPIERPKKGQKAFYSGKKKRHTLKTEI